MSTKYRNPGGELGALVVDWAARTIDYHGMNGDNDTTPEEIIEIFEDAADKPDVEVHGLIVWENGQLSSHDYGGFVEAVESEEDE